MLGKKKKGKIEVQVQHADPSHSHTAIIHAFRKENTISPSGIPEGSLLLTHLTLDTLQPKSKNETRMWLSMPDEKPFKINHTCGCLEERGIIEQRRIIRMRNEFLPNISMPPEP